MQSLRKDKMSILNQHKAEPAMIRHLRMALFGAVALFVAGCGGGGERDENDGQLFNSILLPTDVVLNLYCANVGVFPEDCVLEDPENPYANVTILEFNENNPGAENKFDLYNAIPPGPSGAKARFYLWATALARQPSGENQYYTALHLHELFDANSNVLSTDELVREQALKAYRSALDNFFGGITLFECQACGPISDGEFPLTAVPLNERVADHLYRTESTDFVTPIAPSGLLRLVPGSPILAQEVLGEWGYVYDPCTDLPDCTNGVVSVGTFVGTD